MFTDAPRRRCRQAARGGTAGEKDWGRVQAVVLRTLDAFPEALEAVVEALRAEVEQSGR